MAELKTGQQDVRHRLSLIETQLAGIEHNLADQRYHHDTSPRMA